MYHEGIVFHAAAGSVSPKDLLLIGFWVTFIFGLGGTTPLPRLLLGRAYEILTFERFTFWATRTATPCNQPAIALPPRTAFAERINARNVA